MMKKKIIISIIVVLLIAAISVVIGLYVGNASTRLWIDKYILRKDIGEEDLPTIEFEDSDNITACAYGNYVATVGNNSLKIYNQSGKVESTLNVSIKTPKFFKNGKYLLVADDGASNLYLIYNNTLQWQKTMEADISQITVNESGAVGVVLTGTTYKSVIVMYDVSGNETFKTYLSTTSATDIAISDDTKYLSFVEINTSGTVMESKVKTISIEKAKTTPSESIIYTYTTNNNTLILKIKYKKDSIVAYTDSGIHVYSNGNDQEILSIGSDIKFADINLDGYGCAIKEVTNGIISNEYDLELLNVENQKTTTYIINNTIKSIYCNKNIVAANTGNEVEFINTSGWLVKKFTSIQNIKDISLGEHTAAIIYKDRIEILSL